MLRSRAERLLRKEQRRIEKRSELFPEMLQALMVLNEELKRIAPRDDPEGDRTSAATTAAEVLISKGKHLL